MNLEKKTKIENEIKVWEKYRDGKPYSLLFLILLGIGIAFICAAIILNICAFSNPSKISVILSLIGNSLGVIGVSIFVVGLVFTIRTKKRHDAAPQKILILEAKIKDLEEEDNTDTKENYSLMSENEKIDLLKKYNDLMQSGVISKEEFEAKKAELLK